MFFQKKTGKPTWLVVGLGNPGDQYAYTRHNIGFMVAEELANRQNTPLRKIQFHGKTAKLSFDQEQVLLLTPLTFMNLSGESVIQASQYYDIPPERILVISDEVAFPVGKMKISVKGSAGGHNGLKNIISHLKTQDFPRIRVGVGEKPHPEMDMADWVLGRFSKEDKVEEVLSQVADAVALYLTQGSDQAMAKYNSKGSGNQRLPSPQEAP